MDIALIILVVIGVITLIVTLMKLRGEYKRIERIRRGE